MAGPLDWLFSLGQPTPPLAPPGMVPIETGAEPMPGTAPAQPANTFLKDPVMNLTLLRLAGELMQPIPPGQTSSGQVGRALIGGGETYSVLKQQDYLNQLRGREVASSEKRTSLAEREVVEREKTGELGRMDQAQRMEHNLKTYPKLIEKLQADIDSQVASGKLHSSQADYWKERAKLYPREVDADMKRAEAAMITARKPSGTEAMFNSTAKAMAATGEWASEEDARAHLGEQYFGRAGRASAGVQTMKHTEDLWKRSNPQKENESDEEYDQRAAKATLAANRTQKGRDYAAAKLDFLKNSIDKAADAAEFDKLWQDAGNELPQRADGQPRTSPLPTRGGKVDEKQLRDGTTYDIKTKDYSGPAIWDQKTRKFKPVSGSTN